MHPDQKYITALLENDATLIDKIYSNCSKKIIAMVKNNNGTSMDAADIFQDALLAIYQKAVSGNFELTCPFEGFLYLVCRNKWLNELEKRKGKNVSFKDMEEYNAEDDSLRQAEICSLYHERRTLFDEKIEELSDVCKKLLRLSWTNKSMEDVAALSNMSYAFARKKKSECIGKLIELIKASPTFKNLIW